MFNIIVLIFFGIVALIVLIGLSWAAFYVVKFARDAEENEKALDKSVPLIGTSREALADMRVRIESRLRALARKQWTILQLCLIGAAACLLVFGFLSLAKIPNWDEAVVPECQTQKLPGQATECQSTGSLGKTQNDSSILENCLCCDNTSSGSDRCSTGSQGWFRFTILSFFGSLFLVVAIALALIFPKRNNRIPAASKVAMLASIVAFCGEILIAVISGPLAAVVTYILSHEDSSTNVIGFNPLIGAGGVMALPSAPDSGGIPLIIAYFDVGKHTLQPKDIEAINMVANTLSGCANLPEEPVTIQVRGFASSSDFKDQEGRVIAASREQNLSLAIQRAQALQEAITRSNDETGSVSVVIEDWRGAFDRMARARPIIDRPDSSSELVKMDRLNQIAIAYLNNAGRCQP